MHQFFDLPDWLPPWVPTVLLVVASLWALVFLVMPFSVFGVKNRLELIEARLDEIQNEIRHVALRLPPGGGPGVDYDDVFPPRMQEQRVPERVMSRPPIPPARHELYAADDMPPQRPSAAPMPPVTSIDHPASAERDSPLEDRAPPPLNARPARRTEQLTRPSRSEPRLDWRR